MLQHSDDAIRHGIAHVGATVPEISRFFGIVIQMYHDDHLPPHFHARYGEYRVKVRIADGGTEGAFPPRAAALVLEWWQLHQVELTINWDRARAGKPLRRLAPLE